MLLAPLPGRPESVPLAPRPLAPWPLALLPGRPELVRLASLPRSPGLVPPAVLAGSSLVFVTGSASSQAVCNSK